MYTYLVLRPVFSRDQSSDKLINFLDSQLKTRDSILETRNLILETIEDRASSLKARGTVNLLLRGTVAGFPGFASHGICSSLHPGAGCQ